MKTVGYESPIPAAAQQLVFQEASRSPRANAIKEAATHLFADKGYHATTMTDIGAAVGIKGPSLYKHYPSKQTMLSAVILDTLIEITALQCTVLAQKLTVPRALRLMVENHARFSLANRSEAIVIARECRNLDRASFASAMRLRREYEGRFLSLITDGIQGGQFQTDHPILVARLILDMGNAIGPWYLPDEMHTTDEVVEAFGLFALRILRSGC